MKTTVSIKGAEFHAYHGYYETERIMGNTFVIDAEVELKTFDSIDDDISDTVNYEKIYAICDEEMKRTEKLLETVVLRIIDRFRSSFHDIKGGKVRLEKIGPQLGGKVGKAVIEMEF